MLRLLGRIQLQLRLVYLGTICGHCSHHRRSFPTFLPVQVSRHPTFPPTPAFLTLLEVTTMLAKDAALVDNHSMVLAGL
jgi:hypothetical protein